MRDLPRNLFQEKGPSYSSEALRLIVQDVVKGVGPLDRLRLEDIGCVIQKLMGSGYRATYCRKDFKKRYGKLTQVKVIVVHNSASYVLKYDLLFPENRFNKAYA